MNLSESLALRLEEVFINGTWIANTNYQSELETVDKNLAISQVSPLNTIGEITYHINYYLDGLNHVFNGGKLEIRDKFSFDLPSVLNHEEWEQLSSTLIINAKCFINHVKSLPNEELSKPFVKEKYGSFLRNIEGVIEHSYYHLGQIVLIKRILQEEST